MTILTKQLEAGRESGRAIEIGGSASVNTCVFLLNTVEYQSTSFGGDIYSSWRERVKYYTLMVLFRDNFPVQMPLFQRVLIRVLCTCYNIMFYC